MNYNGKVAIVATIWEFATSESFRNSIKASAQYLVGFIVYWHYK